MKRHPVYALVLLALGLVVAITGAQPPATLIEAAPTTDLTGTGSPRGTLCQPAPGGLSCGIIDCPDGVSKCRPRCVKQLATGEIEIVECDCRTGDECYVLWAAGTLPFCNTFCPPGEVCVRTEFLDPVTGDLTICCDCQPTNECGPESNGLSCRTVTCEDPTEQCVTKCIVINQGVITIDECDCQSPDECHVSWTPGTPPSCVGGCPPGMVCEQQVTTTPTGGTRICCVCVPEVPEICTITPEGTDCVGPCPVGSPIPCRASKITENPLTGDIVVERCGCDCWLRRNDVPPYQFIGCVGKVCAETGEPCEMVVTKNGDGTITYDCCQEPPVCEPEEDRLSCKPVECPDPTSQLCLPKCVLVAFDGTVTINDCDCRSPNECHVLFAPGADPSCVGGCPPNTICEQQIFTTPEGTLICCECVPDPPRCEPTEDRQNCKPFICPNPEETCRPRCVRYRAPGGGLPGFTEVLDCVCRNIEECHVVQIGGAAPSCEGFCPPGMFCARNIVEYSDGSVEICCDCVAPECECPGDVNGDHKVDGLDIAGFVRCLLGNPLPGDNCTCADLNGDGLYNLLDIQFFIQLLFEKPVCNDTECCPREDLVLDLATGVDGDGNLIPAGQDDDNWVVTLDAGGGTVPRPAEIVTPHPFWQTIPGTQWISSDYYGPNGDYAYEFCFCLDDRFKFPTLTVQVRGDDACAVYLNGNFLGFGATFNAATPALITTSNPAFFLPGENCLRVEVQNIGGPPTGINLAGTVTARDGKCCCPPKDLDKQIASGVDDPLGNLIPFGQDDDTWTVTVDASGGSVPRPATVITPHPAWLTIPGTRWISAAQTGPNGDYVYQYCFCLDPRFKNAALSLQLRADDYATVWLNGVQVGATPTSYSFNTPNPTSVVVTNQALFRPCENCVEIVVTNSHGVVTGLNVAGSITADDGLCCDDRVPFQYSCCMPDGSCIDLKPGDDRCPIGGTLILGPCEATVPCCLADGSCIYTDPRCCQMAHGAILSVAADCQTAPEACCYEQQGVTLCIDANPACCIERYGGTPQGPGTICLGDLNNNGTDDACEGPGNLCGPNPHDPLSCLPTQCPSPANEQCMPKCVRMDSVSGAILEVMDCSCQGPDTCRVAWDPAMPILPYCTGTCPPGYICVQRNVHLGDGTQMVCCNCELDPYCPSQTLSGQMCFYYWPSREGCSPPTPGKICESKILVFYPPLFALECNCFVPGENVCGPIDVVTEHTGVSHMTCRQGCPPGAACVIFVNGVPTAANTISTTDLQYTDMVECRCYNP